MNIQKFAKLIQKMNKADWNKVILAFIGFLGFDFCMMLLSGNNDILFLVIGQCILVISSLEVSRYQWNRYLFFIDYEVTLRERKSLSEITRMHAFPVNEYFAYINKRMLVSVILLSVCTALMGILGAMGEDQVAFSWGRYGIILCFALVNGLCPFFVGIWKKKFWNYQSKMGTKGKLNIVIGICGKMFALVEYLFLICVTVIAMVFLWIIIGDMFSPDIDETIAVLRTIPYGYSFILILITVIAALGAMVYYHQMKKLSKVVGAVSIFLFLVSLSVLWAEMRIYTEFSKEQIIVRELWNTNTYKIEDVKRFIIYDEDDRIQMKLYLEDEESVKMNGASQTYSTLYENTYFSDYNFIVDYIKWLEAAGVSGQLEDAQKLQEDVFEMAPQIQEGLEEIIHEMK